MAKLSRHQARFVNEQAIPLSRVFDATGMSQAAYRAAMAELDMIVAIGVSPCRKAGHTLRTRAGHCAQCNTHALAFLRRHDDPGEIYVAHSPQTSLVKVGTSKNPIARISTLNSFGYGGATDWRVYYRHGCAKAGRVEFIAQSKLNAHRGRTSNIPDTHSILCQKIIKINIIKKVLCKCQ